MLWMPMPFVCCTGCSMALYVLMRLMACEDCMIKLRRIWHSCFLFDFVLVSLDILTSVIVCLTFLCMIIHNDELRISLPRPMTYGKFRVTVDALIELIASRNSFWRYAQHLCLLHLGMSVICSDKLVSISVVGHLTSKSDVYSFGVVLLEMLTGRRSMDKNRPNGEHNLVEWARPHLVERRRFYRLIDPRLEGHFSIKGAQKAAQLAAHCLSRDPKVRPLMSEVVEALKPLPNLKDMASLSYHFQTMQADRISSSPSGKNGFRTQGSFSRNGQQQPRSLSIPNGAHASPYHQFAHNSPKPNGKP